jgi:hypothetical protein
MEAPPGQFGFGGARYILPSLFGWKGEPVFY